MPINANQCADRLLKNTKCGLAKIILAASLSLGSSAAGYAILAPARAEAKEQCVPHYLKGMMQPKDRVENMLEKDRVYSTLLLKYPRDPDEKVVNGSIEVDANIFDVDVKLIFPNYVRAGDKVRHYNATGIDTYTEKEFQCIVEDNIEYIKQSAKLAMQDYPSMLEKIIAAQEKELKKEGALKEKEHLKDMLDKDIPGRKIKLRDVLFTPDVTIQDFIPTRYYFGEIGALGVTYISAGLIGIDPKARILDYINGWPTVMVHEMTHNNPKMQGFPLVNKFDAELWATFPMLVHDDTFHFLGHPYLKDVRKISKVLFNFDSRLAYEDIAYFGTLDIMTGIEFESSKKYEKIRSYVEKVTQISAAIRDTAFNAYIPEFYTHPLYYMALNDFLKDKNAAFKLIMYKTYEPTLLGGPEYDGKELVSFETREFIDENRDVIKEISRIVMQELKTKQNEIEVEISPETKLMIREEIKRRLSTMNPSERMALVELAKRFGMPTNGSIEDLIRFGLKMQRLGIADFGTNSDEEALIK